MGWGMTLTASSCPVSWSIAWNTCPVDPRPISLTTLYKDRTTYRAVGCTMAAVAVSIATEGVIVMEVAVKAPCRQLEGVVAVFPLLTVRIAEETLVLVAVELVEVMAVMAETVVMSEMASTEGPTSLA